MKVLMVQTAINAPINIVWKCWTQKEHVTIWNFARADWHCPNATINLVAGWQMILDNFKKYIEQIQ